MLFGYFSPAIRSKSRQGPGAFHSYRVYLTRFIISFEGHRRIAKKNNATLLIFQKIGIRRKKP